MRLLDRDVIDQFRDAVAQRFGLHFDEGKRAFLGEVLAERSGRAGGGGAVGYVQRLLSGQTPREELTALVAELTVGETYFFRHFDQLIAFVDAARAVGECTRRLRILSAGCASGEEAYSLAILLTEQIPDLPDWDVRIVGIDLNPAVLAKAARARYTPWSLRGLPEDIRERYFTAVDKEYQLDATIRAMVSFEERNISEDAPEFWRPGSFDVIFCRNVLMYFTPEACRAVVGRFTHALMPNGYLFLGPAETLRGVSCDFHLAHAHNAFYYQRRTNPVAEHQRPSPVPDTNADSWMIAIDRASDRIARLSRATRPARGFPNAPAPVAAPLPSGLLAARDMIHQEKYADALTALAALTDEERCDPDAKLLRAVSLTNCAQVEEAERLCHEVLAGDELNAEARYLLALCREHAGDYEAAREQDQTAIYLDPRFAMPHLHLGLLNKRLGDHDEARQAFRNALALLPHENAGRILLFGSGFSRESLLRLCEAELRGNGGTA